MEEMAMRKPLYAAALLLAAGMAAWAQAGESHLMRLADVHGDQVVFTYEDDLWTASTRGGDASRLTRDDGGERYAKFSPDGKRIAFTGQYDGGVDVYVMDAAGSPPVRLTYHPAPDLVLGWTPDGASVLFRSRREFPFRGEQVYTVPAVGGTERKLAVDRAGLAALSPDGRNLAYCRLSNEGATWKRHQGGDAQEIWMGSFEKADFRVIAPWKGIDNFPMWEGEAIYFASDREAGTVNLFRYDVKTGEVRALTQFTDYDVKYPSSGPGAIVFQYAESLHLLDLDTGAVRKLAIRIPSDRVPVRSEFVAVKAGHGGFGLNPDGSRLLLESRGEVLSIPVEKKKGEPVNLSRASGSREKDPDWSPDGTRVAFLSDRTGEEEVYLASAEGLQPWKQLTSGGLGYRMRLTWSPDSKWLLFSDKFMKLHLVDAATGKITVLDQGEYDDGWERWGIQDFTFSPDSRWIAYTKKLENTYEAIYLYGLDSAKSVALTDGMANSWSPSFDPAGKYLYFLSDRAFNPIMGTVGQDHVFLKMASPFLAVLKAADQSPFGPEAEAAEAAAGAADKGSKEKAKAAVPTASSIDLPGLADRVLPVEGVEPGNYFRLEATESGFLYLSKTEPEFLKYQTVTDANETPCELMAYDLKEKKAESVASGVENYHLSADRKKMAVRANGAFSVSGAGQKAKPDQAVDLSEARIKVDRMAEFGQIFDEAWRIERDWFYDKNLHGVDWKKTGEMYRRFLPDCGNRSDLNYLIGEMIAELNTGHTYVGGGDLGDPGSRSTVGLLGCDFDLADGAAFPVIRHILPSYPWDSGHMSPLREPGLPVREGQYLIAVDGEKVSPSTNLYACLENKAGKTVRLTVNDRPSEEGARTFRVRTLRSEATLRYREWVERNRAYVDKVSGGTVGYVHLPAMMEDGLVEFARYFYPQLGRKAILLDARYNGGGFTSGMIIDRLERKVWAVTQPREGKPSLNPEAAFWGPYALLVNEDTGSDGELFSEAIQIKGLAKIFGMRTWGGAFGIEAHQDLVDGGTVTPPQFGLYSLDRRWLIEGRGVDPDVEVQNMPGDVLKGKDAQLDAALAYLLDLSAKTPGEVPPPPPYPKKARPAGSDISRP
jgi:tricorn protease